MSQRQKKKTERIKSEEEMVLTESIVSRENIKDYADVLLFQQRSLRQRLESTHRFVIITNG